MKKTSILISLALVLSITSVFASGDPDTFQTVMNNEYQVKLAMIEKFTVFIEWPKEAKINTDSAALFTFGIYGEVSPFGDDLKALKSERRLKWKKVNIRFYESKEDFDVVTPDLLFVPKEYTKELEKIATAAAGKPVLIISDEKGGIDKGALLGIYLDGDKMRLQANREKLMKAGFKVSSDLLRLAD